jgi:hypothetical protein
MNIVIWIFQGLLAAMFGMAGSMKSFQSQAKLAKKIPMAKEGKMVLVRFIGISELLGAIGVVVPQLTGIVPILTPLAAAGLAVIMLLATGLHLSKGEAKETAFTAVLLVMSVAVAYYRWVA